MKVMVNVSARQIADQFVAAIEGGSNYWCKGVTLKGATLITRIEDGRQEPVLSKPWYDTEALFADNCDFAIEVEELWNDEADGLKKHTINRVAVNNGLELLAAKWPHHFKAIVADEGDAETADCFLQCVALGDIVYR